MATGGDVATLDCPKCSAVNPDTSRFCGACASPLSPPDGPPTITAPVEPLPHGLQPGTVVAGKYRVLGEIGRGGMGIVYEADDVKLRRAVALKFLPLELTDDAEARERFVHEAQAASVLDNPHICTIHEIGEGEDRRMFIAMALCQGESLRAKIKRGPLPAAEALSLAAQVADGLAAAHAHGIVHRDVKPANILVSREGVARVADFGLAKIAGEVRLTREGRTVGTVAYMSPEQLRGEDVDARTDVWSLGVVLYEMLTGALPFHGTNEHSLAYAIVHGEPKPLSALPPGTPDGCVRILEHALSKDPAERFASAAEMAEAIADVRAGAGFTGSRRATTGRGHFFEPPPRSLVRRLAPFVLIAALAAASLAFRVPYRLGVLFGIVQSSPARHITVFDPVVLGESQPDRVLAAGFAQYLRFRLDQVARRSRSWVTPGEDNYAYEVREAADALSVLGSNVAVTGTFKRVGDNVSLSFDVFDPARYQRLASVVKTDHIANIATWQDDLVREAAAALGVPAAPSGSAAQAGGTTVPAAFEAYLRGLGYLASLGATPGAGSPEYAATIGSAVGALEEAVGLDPSFVAASIDLADAYRLKTVPGTDPSPAQRGETLLRSIIKADGSLARAHMVLGSTLRKLGRDGEAGPELEKAATLDPLSFDALIRLAYFYENGNEPAKAETAYRAALKVRPGYWAGATYLGLFHFYRGAYDKALDELESVTRICPKNVIAFNDLGAALFKMGLYDRSIAAFERSNSVKRNPDACGNLATLYYYSGRFSDSVNMNENAIGFGRSAFDYVIWGNLGDAYRFTPGNERKAAEAYARAIKLTEDALAVDPGDARARSSLAGYMAKSGQPGRAREELETVLRAKPGDPAIVLRAVFVYELIGERARALDSLRDYVELGGPMEEIVRDPLLAALRQDPGFAKIVTSKPAGAAKAKSG